MQAHNSPLAKACAQTSQIQKQRFKSLIKAYMISKLLKKTETV